MVSGIASLFHHDDEVDECADETETEDGEKSAEDGEGLDCQPGHGAMTAIIRPHRDGSSGGLIQMAIFEALDGSAKFVDLMRLNDKRVDCHVTQQRRDGQPGERPVFWTDGEFDGAVAPEESNLIGRFAPRRGRFVRSTVGACWTRAAGGGCCRRVPLPD